MSATIVRAQALRAAARPAVRAVPTHHYPQRARAYATTPSPPGGEAAPNPAASKGGSNLALYGILAAGAAGGYYYYSTSTATAGERRKADEEAVKGHLNAAGGAAKAGAHDALAEGQQKYGEVKMGEAGVLIKVQGSADDKLAQARARTEKGVADAQSTLGAYTSQAKSAANSAASSAQHQYDQAKSSASATLSDAERKLEEAKLKTEKEAQSWWNWLTFGVFGGSGAKKQEGADKVMQESASLSEVQRKNCMTTKTRTRWHGMIDGEILRKPYLTIVASAIGVEARDARDLLLRVVALRGSVAMSFEDVRPTRVKLIYSRWKLVRDMVFRYEKFVVIMVPHYRAQPGGADPLDV
ncbi:hypothetical protein OE88DRAFT_1642559 [Heliocybe sulcata]|uniref:Uncharacterized protein n=1 Tax=Heliocybe sulcata TaxID=5364 RepID=A0A5C3N833_9AGAM|nr:hypothetical protein OE88DRAFT_1642559 [Heliocybe sulcata]